MMDSGVPLSRRPNPIRTPERAARICCFTHEDERTGRILRQAGTSALRYVTPNAAGLLQATATAPFGIVVDPKDRHAAGTSGELRYHSSGLATWTFRG